MSRPKNWWYGTVRKIIYHYPSMKGVDSELAKIMCKAVEQALDDISKEQDEQVARAKMVAIKWVFFDWTKDVYGAAMTLHYCERTVHGWINSFVNKVGQYMGFPCLHK